MTPDPILEKIKKLLRMKRGGTPAEIETALNLARELADKHGIEIEKVNPDESSEPRKIGMQDAYEGARIQTECKLAALIVQNFFSVTVVYRGGYRRRALTIVGTEWDCQIATYVYTFCVRAFRREWITRRGRCRNREAFMQGMYLGLYHKLKQRQRLDHSAQENGLLRINQGIQLRNDFIKDRFGNIGTETTKFDNDSSVARSRGIQAGLDTEINQGLNGASSPKRAALNAPAPISAQRELTF